MLLSTQPRQLVTFSLTSSAAPGFMFVLHMDVATQVPIYAQLDRTCAGFCEAEILYAEVDLTANAAREISPGFLFNSQINRVNFNLSQKLGIILESIFGRLHSLTATSLYMFFKRYAKGKDCNPPTRGIR